MFKTIQLGEFSFDYHASMKCFCDEKRERVAFVSGGYDEIHLIIEIVAGRLVFHPRWNIKIETVQGTSKQYRLDVNFSDQLLNLDDLSIEAEQE